MSEHTECRHLLGSLSEYIDGSLSAELCSVLERHLSECENCRIVVDSLNRTVYLYRTTSSQESVPDGLRDRLFKRLNLDDYLGEK